MDFRNIEDLKLEEQHLKDVRGIVKKELDIAIKDSSIKKDDASSLKQYVWNSINTSNCEMDNLETYFYFNEANEMEDVSFHKKDRANLLKRVYSSAYFGRIDFKLNEKIDKVYIGITNVYNDFDLLVYDWRSPVASLFYNYGRGKASYEAPVGKIDGEILIKRQYKIEDDKIVRIIDSDINIDDEYLQEILCSSSDDKMKNVVSTIQLEQNEIIRNNLNRSIIVQGIAGSGKTSVAMHRIAYMLYDIKDIKSSDFLIFSPNNIFSNYISDVLPELGEENIMNIDFSSFAFNHLKEVTNIETFSKYLKRIYKEDSNDESIKFKMSHDAMNKCDEFIKIYKDELQFTKGLKIRNESFFSSELNTLFNERYKSLNVLDRIYKITDYMSDKLEIKKRDLKIQIFDLLIGRMNKEIDIVSIYNYFADYVGNIKKIDSSYVNYEDVPILLYLKFELFGYPFDGKVKYLTIDEGQDYNYIQYVILKKIFRNSYFSIYGDVNQTLNFYIDYLSLEELSEIFKDSLYIELNKTYRSSKEILEYTNDILGISYSEAIRRSYDCPVIVRDKSYDINLDIEMLKERFNSIAIIIKNDTSLNISGFKILTDDDKEIGRLSIIPVYLAKGLEFDAVIVYDLENELQIDKRKFYLACTRAQHQLIIYN